MQGTLAGRACLLLLSLAVLVGATPARADGSFPEPQHILLPAARPQQIILGTNFGLLFSDDDGATWSFSCEQPLSAYAVGYQLGAHPTQRVFAMTAGAGLIHSDDDSCSWTAARGTLTDVMPYSLAIDPSNWRRVYVIGVLREGPRVGESLYVSDDGGLTFGEPVFTAPVRSALLTVMVAPSRPSTLYATMFSTPENHPILLRSGDSGEHWEVVADLVDALGENPFELLSIDPSDENRLYVRILEASAETLAISDDGGLSFVRSVSFPGKLRAFLKLASGTILVGGTAGSDPLGYRSTDSALSFEPWPEAPHVHALAERNGKLYVAGENFWDGYAIAVSDDEGAHLQPLTGFREVQRVKSCVQDLCADSCAYYAGINLWSEAVCRAETSTPDGGGAAGAAPSGVVSGASAGGGGEPATTADDEPPPVDESGARGAPRISGGGCACGLVDSNAAHGWATLLALGSLLAARGQGRRRKRGNHVGACRPRRDCRLPGPEED